MEAALGVGGTSRLAGQAWNGVSSYRGRLGTSMCSEGHILRQGGGLLSIYPQHSFRVADFSSLSSHLA